MGLLALKGSQANAERPVQPGTTESRVQQDTKELPAPGVLGASVGRADPPDRSALLGQSVQRRPWMRSLPRSARELRFAKRPRREQPA